MSILPVVGQAVERRNTCHCCSHQGEREDGDQEAGGAEGWTDSRSLMRHGVAELTRSLRLQGILCGVTNSHGCSHRCGGGCALWRPRQEGVRLKRGEGAWWCGLQASLSPPPCSEGTAGAGTRLARSEAHLEYLRGTESAHGGRPHSQSGVWAIVPGTWTQPSPRAGVLLSGLPVPGGVGRAE